MQCKSSQMYISQMRQKSRPPVAPYQLIGRNHVLSATLYDQTAGRRTLVKPVNTEWSEREDAIRLNSATGIEIDEQEGLA